MTATNHPSTTDHVACTTTPQHFAQPAKMKLAINAGN
jgi:hypothetical protein